MNYFIFKEQIFTIFLSMNHLTGVDFPYKHKSYVGGQMGDFKVHELNKESLVFETKRKDFKRNFLIYFNNREKYHFNLIYSEELKTPDVKIHQARKCALFSLIKETKDYLLFECPKSLFLVNKKKNPLSVNDFKVKDKAYLSKGPPTYINERLVYFDKGVL